MAALSVVPAPLAPLSLDLPTPRFTLYELEEHLIALADSTEMVAPEQEQEFLVEFQSSLLAAKDKRDCVGQFLAHCEGQATLAKEEIARLRKRQTSFEAAVERMEGYVLRVVQSQELDAKGKYPKLEGHTSSFGAQRNPPAVIITDEAAVPAAYKTVSITLPALLWEAVCDSLALEFRAEVLDAVRKPEVAVLKGLVKDAVAATVPDWKKELENRPSVYTDSIPGAAIAAGEFRLVRR
jgi:hypothetical protein